MVACRVLADGMRALGGALLFGALLFVLWVFARMALRRPGPGER